MLLLRLWKFGELERARTLKFVFCKILLGRVSVYVNNADGWMSDTVKESCQAWERCFPVCSAVFYFYFFFFSVSTNALQLSFCFHVSFSFHVCLIFISWLSWFIACTVQRSSFSHPGLSRDERQKSRSLRNTERHGAEKRALDKTSLLQFHVLKHRCLDLLK